jgi:putative transposase
VRTAIGDLTPTVGVRAACEAFDFPRSSFYRKGFSGVLSPAAAAVRFVPRALVCSEREAVLSSLHEERFQNSAPAAVYATLLDEGRYHCSIRTMYRILESAGEVRERRDQLVHPAYTKLLGPAKWTYFYLYVILDVFSRYVVGWMVADGESSELAKRLIADTSGKQKIEPGKLTIHADRGSSMTSKPVAFLMADLGITKTHSRPHVSDDNPYSESHFRTLKYRPGFPERFGSLQDARSFSQEFFAWYNDEHRHSGLGLLSPAVVHHGLAPKAIEQRRAVLDAAYSAHPERFVRKPPQPLRAPTEVWINKPQTSVII